MPRLREHGVRLGLKKPGGRPFEKGHKKLGGRKKGTPNRATRDVKEFFKEFLESAEYQENVQQRILAGRALPIEQVGLFYTAGKPRERVEVESKNLAELVWSVASTGHSREAPPRSTLAAGSPDRASSPSSGSNPRGTESLPASALHPRLRDRHRDLLRVHIQTHMPHTLHRLLAAVRKRGNVTGLSTVSG
jgi:hypothetical protein